MPAEAHTIAHDIAAPMERADPPLRIALFGLFGVGNLGNEGSLEAMVATLRRIAPTADVTCICARPDALDPGLALRALNWTRPELRPGLLARLNAVMLRLPYKLLGPVRAMRILREFDVVIVPGTGILDDFGERPWGAPYVILKWAVAARLMGRRYAMASIGAGPIRDRLSRAFMVTAARLAGYVSYRDRGSAAFMRQQGLIAGDDNIFPDLAFGLDAQERPPRQPGQPPVIGLGVMRYRGWSATDGGIYEAYLEKLTAFVLRQLERGFRIRLIIGEDADALAVEDLRARVARVSAEAATALDYQPAYDLHDVMHQMAGVDVAVVTRFHNLVCALKVRTPAISLSYGAKNDLLLADMGLGAFTAHAERFELSWLEDRLQAALDTREALAARIAARLDDYSARLTVQEERLRRFLQGAR